MTEADEAPDKIRDLLQLDAVSRLAEFSTLLALFKKLERLNLHEQLNAFARRAVSPLLDYPSMMALYRILSHRRDRDRIGTVARIAILGGPTTVQLRQLIEVFLAGEGIDAEIYECEYGLFRQEVLVPGSGLDAFRPSIVLFAVSTRDVSQFPALESNEETVESFARQELSAWENLWRTANEKWNAVVIQNNFEVSPGSVLGHYALRQASSKESYLERLNRLFAERAPSYVLIHDLRGLAAEAGSKAWFDPRFYFEFKMPCGPEALVSYAYSVVSLVRAIVGKSKKVLVLDLDNTLWGGVIGDVGVGGIRYGQGSGEGEAFLSFQQYAKDLQNRGIVLAVCSKNDEQNAREPFEKRDDMVLKIADISCFVANWEHKADNLRTIADRLELGLDSFVFVDDNPAERAIVRRFLPQVAVPDMPEDPSGYIQALAVHRYFETTSFTREDTARARYYAENAQRKDLQSRATDVDSFLSSLHMRMKVCPITDVNIERATQLINKSNQFNLTTRRYTIAQIKEISTNSNWLTVTLSLSDSLGDNGLISVMLLQKHDRALSIDTWVMSCRVLLRGVEQFARNELVDIARKLGCDKLLGTYIPTAKNGMVREHYGGLGFAQAGVDGDKTFWSLDLNEVAGPFPCHIKREEVK